MFNEGANPLNPISNPMENNNFRNNNNSARMLNEEDVDMGMD